MLSLIIEKLSVHTFYPPKSSMMYFLYFPLIGPVHSSHKE